MPPNIAFYHVESNLRHQANAHTIYTLINTTLGNLSLFSAAALRSRKTKGGSDPDWLEDFVAEAWTPTSTKDLRHLKVALAPHTRRFEKVYRPIRHAIYAHTLMSNDQAGTQLFGETRRDEVARILDFLHDLIGTVRNLYDNGRKPKLGKRDFTEYNERIRNGAATVLRKLARN
jgi:hypothetical protein